VLRIPSVRPTTIQRNAMPFGRLNPTTRIFQPSIAAQQSRTDLEPSDVCLESRPTTIQRDAVSFRAIESDVAGRFLLSLLFLLCPCSLVLLPTSKTKKECERKRKLVVGVYLCVCMCAGRGERERGCKGLAAPECLNRISENREQTKIGW